MEDWIYRTVVQQAEAIRRGELSSAELVEASINRIRSVNPGLNAVVQLDADRAMDEAHLADAERERGQLWGPLHGVPMTIKDSLDTARVITTWGTAGRRALVPQVDATVVARLKAAGAILLGKTNTPELTLSFSTDNKVYGRTNNPYDLDRTPGGSSGGAAAIVASGGSAFDIGSDTGGSIRLPAHFCGVCGIRPTSGRVPRTGHAIPPGGPLDALTQIGPLARSVGDLALILPIIAGPDNTDAWVVPVPMGRIQELTLKGRRLAFFTDNGISSPVAEVEQAVIDSVGALSRGGAVVSEIRPHAVEECFEIFNELFLQWLLPWALKRLAGEGTSKSDLAIEGWEQVKIHTVDDLLRSFERWNGFRMRMSGFMADYDLLLSPVMAYPAYLHGAHSDDDEAFSYTYTFSLTGWPVAVVPVRWTEGGLPIGVQIAAQPWREDVALAAGAYLERAFGGWRRPAG